MPRVLNKRTDLIPRAAVYVGRPGFWGNPFVLHDERMRDAILDSYVTWLHGSPEGKLRLARISELRGKDLVCWCAPKRCHADILLELANA